MHTGIYRFRSRYLVRYCIVYRVQLFRSCTRNCLADLYLFHYYYYYYCYHCHYHYTTNDTYIPFQVPGVHGIIVYGYIQFVNKKLLG